MRTLLQGVLMEAEGVRSSLVGAMAVNSGLGSGATGATGSGTGGKMPLALPHLHADPLAQRPLCSRAAGKISSNALAVASKGFASDSCEGVAFHRKLTPTF